MKYVKIFFIGFFFFGCTLSWANTAVVLKRSISDSLSVIKTTDSTISKTKTSTVNSFVSQNYNYLTNLRKDVFEAARREKGNSVSTNSFTINNQLIPSTLSNVVSFNIYDKALNVHSFSGTQSTMQPLTFTFENKVNTKVELYGFEYRFKRTENKKFEYLARVRLERDNENNSFYQLGIGANFRKNKGGSFVGLEYFPARSGPGHILKIYRTQLSNYNEFRFAKKLKHLASIEGSYYSDQNADFIVVSRTEYLAVETSTFSVSPLIESGYGIGRIDRRDGYPYWMAKKRLYGGGGLAFGIGSETSTFQMVADASIFSEAGQPSFERYTGSLSYQIKNFSKINAGFEFYTIENFYSNVFQLGMVYNFK